MPAWSKPGMIFLLTPEEDLKVLSSRETLTPLVLEELKANKSHILQEIRQKYGDLPHDWVNAMQMILGRNKPQCITETVWISLCKRLKRLLQKERSYLFQFIEQEWSLQDIFGCHQDAPVLRHDGKGLLMLLGNKTIFDVVKENIALKSTHGAITRFYRSKQNLVEYTTLMALT